MTGAMLYAFYLQANAENDIYVYPWDAFKPDEQRVWDTMARLLYEDRRRKIQKLLDANKQRKAAKVTDEVLLDNEKGPASGLQLPDVPKA